MRYRYKGRFVSKAQAQRLGNLRNTQKYLKSYGEAHGRKWDLIGYWTPEKLPKPEPKLPVKEITYGPPPGIERYGEIAIPDYVKKEIQALDVTEEAKKSMTELVREAIEKDRREFFERLGEPVFYDKELEIIMYDLLQIEYYTRSRGA